MSGEGAGSGAALQDDLQEAISAHAAREQTAEYSDDFESDEDGMTSCFHEKKLQQIMLLESENIQDDRKDGEEECLENQNEVDDRKDNEECSAAEEVPRANSESDHCNDLPICEVQKKRKAVTLNQEENKPIPKPRVHKTRNASASDQDQKNISTSDLKLEDNSRKSPSVIEVMMTTVYEKTKELEESTDYSSDKKLKIVEGKIETDTRQEVSVNDQSEHGEAKNTSKDSVKKLSETKDTVLQNPKASLSGRSLSSPHLKKKAKAVPSAAPVLSQYLGTLKVLEDKRVQNNNTEFDKADSLRAAVFQNWLEKKRVFLLELKRIEKKKAEELRNNNEKKEAVKREEAIASFEAWKKKKGREAKKLSEKKKLEELKQKKAAEQNEDKMEAAQKAFEKWKERKVEYLREQSRKEKQSERIRKKKEEELVAEKKRDSMSAVEKWNEKKEEYMKQKKVEKIQERRKQEIQQAKKEEKNKKAMEEYERWLEKKERREQLEKKQKKLQAVHGDEAPSPWSPPGKVTYSRNY
ncbi:microtubule-associated protein 9 isoform X2 [Grus americana]|uniref:microtubule-associated protein 9 isoform X2 n=1 Tax=Grus americana TaxID=9117 RepID=UPI0024086A0B|nr:microtubule-associated protein 9 isoform X2 [Grus americana]